MQGIYYALSRNDYNSIDASYEFVIILQKPAWQRDSDSDEDSSDHDDILYDKTQLRQVTNVNGNVDNLNRRSNDTLNMMSNDGEHTEICLDDSDSENTADERSKMITQTSPSRTKKRKCGFCGIHVSMVDCVHMYFRDTYSVTPSAAK